jgi:hypothetical protein
MTRQRKPNQQCRFFKKGTCTKGNQCEMAHGAHEASPVAGGGEADSVLDDEATLAGEAQRQRGSDGDAALNMDDSDDYRSAGSAASASRGEDGEELVLRDRLWEWVHANWEIFDEFGSCHVSHLLRAENGFKQHLPEGFLPQSKPEKKMYNWLGTVVGLETLMDGDGRRSFRIMEDTAALTEFENAFGRYVKGHDAGRYFSFVEMGQDVGVEGAADMGYEALKARVAELPYVTVTGRFTSGDSFQVDQSAVTARLINCDEEGQEEDQEEDQAEGRGQAAPVRKKHRTH